MSTCCSNELILLTSSRLIKFSNSNTTSLRLILRPSDHSPWGRSQVGSTENIPDSSSAVTVLELTCVVFLIGLTFCFAVRVGLSIPVLLFVYLINAKICQLYLFALIAILTCSIAPSSKVIYSACVAAQWPLSLMTLFC